MKNGLSESIKRALIGLLALIGFAIISVHPVLAEGYSLTMSPMNQDVVINPGESYQASFRISNGASSTRDTYYSITVEPFTINDDKVEHIAEGQSGEIVKWVRFDVPTEGKLVPNETKEIIFTINVPESAPAGGQYLSVLVTTSSKSKNDEKESGDESNTAINEEKRMGHLVYAEITGDTVKTGEFLESNVPSFLLSGNISGSARVRNTGNVHQKAFYTLQVYPLFSGEEIYTNEDKPASYNVMPDKEVFSEISWEQTPPIGIFNVVFKGEFAGRTLEVKKMVIKCPVWLLFIILFVIAAVIIYFVARARKRSGRTDS